MDNLAIYNRAKEVPPEAKKPITAGRLKGFTDINPMWRIKRLTEIFGPCGIGWWYEITGKEIVHDDATKQSAAFLDILLYYKDPSSGEVSRGIPGTGGSSFVANEKSGPYLSDECYKMALSDAISVAAKSIGLGADVYYAKDRDKYTLPDQYTPEMQFTCSECGAVLQPYKNADGKEISVRRHAVSTEKKFGRVLCLECAMKAGKNEN